MGAGEGRWGAAEGGAVGRGERGAGVKGGGEGDEKASILLCLRWQRIEEENPSLLGVGCKTAQYRKQPVWFGQAAGSMNPSPATPTCQPEPRPAPFPAIRPLRSPSPPSRCGCCSLSDANAHILMIAPRSLWSKGTAAVLPTVGKGGSLRMGGWAVGYGYF